MTKSELIAAISERARANSISPRALLEDLLTFLRIADRRTIGCPGVADELCPLAARLERTTRLGVGEYYTALVAELRGHPTTSPDDIS